MLLRRTGTLPAMSEPPTRKPDSIARAALRARQRAKQDAEQEARTAQIVSDLVAQAPPMTDQMADELRPLLLAKNVANERTRGRELRPLDEDSAPEQGPRD